MKTKETTGLIVTGRTLLDNYRIQLIITGSFYFAEFNAIDGYFFFEEIPECFDTLEMQLQNLFEVNGISARFEGQE